MHNSDLPSMLFVVAESEYDIVFPESQLDFPVLKVAFHLTNRK